jgi:3-oxoacyl-(acyl-carrier-protein) synthase
MNCIRTSACIPKKLHDLCIFHFIKDSEQHFKAIYLSLPVKLHVNFNHKIKQKNKNMKPIAIRSIGTISALGGDKLEVLASYNHEQKHYLSFLERSEFHGWAGKISETNWHKIDQIRNENNLYKPLDNSVLLGIYAARQAFENSGWDPNAVVGVNMGSSRGATEKWENIYANFLANKQVPVLASPITTLGNIATWVAYDLEAKGPTLSHSITCSTALHAVLNGIAWLNSGMSDHFLAGGSEAPLTAFTKNQMQALKIYSTENQLSKYPCQSLNLQAKKNSMVLGEGAGVVAMDRAIDKNALACIVGIGYATEKIKHGASISTDAICFQKSMLQALEMAQIQTVDAIILHAPGTIQGDQSELKAIEKIFTGKKPFCTSNKWKLGHTLGASGVLSLEMAILMLQEQEFFGVPFEINGQIKEKNLKNILINAVGFGGNAVSIIIQNPNL